MRLTPALELHPEPVSGVTLLSYGILTRDMMEGCVSIFYAVWFECQCVRSALRQDFDGAYQRLASAGSWAHLYMRPMLKVMSLQCG